MSDDTDRSNRPQEYLDESIDKIDTVDFFSTFAATLGAAVMTGLATISVAGNNLGDIAYTLGSATDLSYAITLVVAGIATAFITNRRGDDGMEFDGVSPAEKGAVLSVVVVTVLYVVSPDMASFVEASTVRQAAYTVLNLVAVLVIASE